MLLPDKHITLAESLLGFGAFLLAHLDSPKTVDQLYQKTRAEWEAKYFPAYHDYDSVVTAVLFLFALGIVEATDSGAVKKCDS